MPVIGSNSVLTVPFIRIIDNPAVDNQRDTDNQDQQWYWQVLTDDCCCVKEEEKEEAEKWRCPDIDIGHQNQVDLGQYLINYRYIFSNEFYGTHIDQNKHFDFLN